MPGIIYYKKCPQEQGQLLRPRLTEASKNCGPGTSVGNTSATSAILCQKGCRMLSVCRWGHEKILIEHVTVSGVYAFLV
jgi:hypothetical protein